MRLWRQFRSLPGIVQVVAALLALFCLLSIDCYPAAKAGAEVVGQGHDKGQLKAGAARVSIDPPFPIPIGGFTSRGSRPFEGILGSLGVRALVVEVGTHRVGLVSAEMVVMSPPLRRKVLELAADLRLDDVFIGATHTHSGPGGYWKNIIAEGIGLGAYDPKIEAFLAERMAQALREAAGALRPARIAEGHIEASNYGYNRNEGQGPVDTDLLGLRVTGLDGRAIANLIVYAIHPTIIQMTDMHLSGDWPGSMMAALEAEDGPPTLFLQGAVGDVTWGKRLGEMSRPDRAIRFGQAVAADARGALAAGGEGEGAVALDWARVAVGLPKCDVSGAVSWPFGRLVSNAFCWLARPDKAEVSFVRIGPAQFAGVPGEAVASLGIAWRKALGGAEITSLMDGYVGYIEAPGLVESGAGESRHTYFGPSLAPRLFEGLSLARETAVGH